MSSTNNIVGPTRVNVVVERFTCEKLQTELDSIQISIVNKILMYVNDNKNKLIRF